MHLLVAIAEALAIPVDDLVLNRTTLQQLRIKNRHSEFDAAKSDTINRVIYIFLSWFHFEFALFTPVNESSLGSGSSFNYFLLFSSFNYFLLLYIPYSIAQ